MSFDHTDAERFGLLVTAATAVAGLAVRPRLPGEVAIHFSASGTSDTYVPRAVVSCSCLRSCSSRWA